MMTSQSSLDIPTAIAEGDEASTDGSSTRKSAAGSARNLKTADTSKTSRVSRHPYEVREQTFSSPRKVATVPLNDELSQPNRLEKKDSQLSGYSTDNTTLAESVPVDMQHNPLQKIPSDLVAESRDDVSYEDSDAEASQSYADSSIPSAYKDPNTGDNVSVASSTSSWMYNDVKLPTGPTMESTEEGGRRQAVESGGRWESFE